MIRRRKDQAYHFVEGLSHAEDLVFYLSICDNRKYSYTGETVLYYRTGTGSAMTDLDGIRKGYKFLFKFVNDNFQGRADLIAGLRKKLFSIMFRSYLKKGRFLKAFRSVEFYL
jgi:hypothetical protein